MSVQNRITVSASDTIEHLENSLERLRRFIYDREYRRILGDTPVNHLEEWDVRIRSRRKDPFTLVVVGEFKRGKSSLINALLGEEIMITDAVPETVTMNKLSFGTHKNEAVLSGGRKIGLSDEELCRSALEKLMKEVGEPIRQLEMTRPNEWLKDIRIIDTPGLNETTDDHLDNIVAEAMSQADAVIYVYSVNSPLSRNEMMYLRYAILPQNYTKLFMVSNYGDILRNKEAVARAGDMLKERTKDLLPGEHNYLISSLDEICRISGNERPSPEIGEILEKEFSLLRAAIDELINDKKTIITADRMQRMTNMMIEEIEADINNIEKALEMSGKQLAEEREKLSAEENKYSQSLEEAKAKLTETASEMKENADIQIRELLLRMENEDLSSYSVQDISQYYAYYCLDLLQEATQECLEADREKLLENMSDISDELGKDLAGAYAAGDRISFSFRLNNKTWTSGDSITLAITTFSGSRLVNTLADLAGSLTKKNGSDTEKTKLLEAIKEKYPGLVREAHQQLEKQYSGLTRSACRLLEDHYNEQIHKARETITQYEEISRKRDEDKKQVSLAARELRDTLSSFVK